ncbi:MAG: metallophosphoesterase [Calditrichia bacterium]
MQKRFIILALMLLQSLVWADELQRLTVFFTNDVHGGIVPQKAEFLNPEFPPVLGGAASAAGIIKNIRESVQAEGGSTLLIDGGDTFQGTLVGTLSGGEAVVDYFNMMGYDAVVPGNHDFDQGKTTLSSASNNLIFRGWRPTFSTRKPAKCGNG